MIEQAVIERRIKEKARELALEHYHNPTSQDLLLIEIILRHGWIMAVNEYNSETIELEQNHEEMESLQPGNPLTQDMYHMATNIGSNVCILSAKRQAYQGPPPGLIISSNNNV